jgi:hypothetical protein
LTSSQASPSPSFPSKTQLPNIAQDEIVAGIEDRIAAWTFLPIGK